MMRCWSCAGGATSLEEGIRLSSALLAETAMCRFKQLLTGKLSLRKYNNQVG